MPAGNSPHWEEGCFSVNYGEFEAPDLQPRLLHQPAFGLTTSAAVTVAAGGCHFRGSTGWATISWMAMIGAAAVPVAARVFQPGFRGNMGMAIALAFSGMAAILVAPVSVASPAVAPP